MSISLSVALISAAAARSQDGSDTLDFSRLNLGDVPEHAVDELADRGRERRGVRRLALSHNSLAFLPANFHLLQRLRYLNLKGNDLREIPPELCELAGLEILDLSKNKIVRFPPSPGHLSALRVLSLSQNRLTTLPAYFHEFAELKVLKLDHNPLEWPPAWVLERGDGEGGLMDEREWIGEVREFMRREPVGEEYDEEEEGSDGFGGQRTKAEYVRPPRGSRMEEGASRTGSSRGGTRARADGAGARAVRAAEPEPPAYTPDSPVGSYVAPSSTLLIPPPPTYDLPPSLSPSDAVPSTSSTPPADGSEPSTPIPSAGQPMLGARPSYDHPTSPAVGASGDTHPPQQHRPTTPFAQFSKFSLVAPSPTRGLSGGSGASSAEGAVHTGGAHGPPASGNGVPGGLVGSHALVSSATEPGPSTTSATLYGLSPRQNSTDVLPSSSLAGARGSITSSARSSLSQSAGPPGHARHHSHSTSFAPPRESVAVPRLASKASSGSINRLAFPSSLSAARAGLGGQTHDRAGGGAARAVAFGEGVAVGGAGGVGNGSSAAQAAAAAAANASNGGGQLIEGSRDSYFRRLSTLPASTIPASMPSSLLVLIDAARGLLFALAQIQATLRRHPTSPLDDRFAGVLSRVLSPAAGATDGLINALDRFDSTSRRASQPPARVVRGVVEALKANVGAYGKVVAVLIIQLKVSSAKLVSSSSSSSSLATNGAGSGANHLHHGSSTTGGSSRGDRDTFEDIRFTRTLLLNLYGALGEVAHAWTTMSAVLPDVLPLLRDPNAPPRQPLSTGPPSSSSSAAGAGGAGAPSPAGRQHRLLSTASSSRAAGPPMSPVPERLEGGSTTTGTPGTLDGLSPGSVPFPKNTNTNGQQHRRGVSAGGGLATTTGGGGGGDGGDGHRRSHSRSHSQKIQREAQQHREAQALARAQQAAALQQQQQQAAVAAAAPPAQAEDLDGLRSADRGPSFLPPPAAQHGLLLPGSGVAHPHLHHHQHQQRPADDGSPTEPGSPETADLAGQLLEEAVQTAFAVWNLMEADLQWASTSSDSTHSPSRPSAVTPTSSTPSSGTGAVSKPIADLLALVSLARAHTRALHETMRSAGSGAGAGAADGQLVEAATAFFQGVRKVAGATRVVFESERREFRRDLKVGLGKLTRLTMESATLLHVSNLKRPGTSMSSYVPYGADDGPPTPTTATAFNTPYSTPQGTGMRPLALGRSRSAMAGETLVTPTRADSGFAHSPTTTTMLQPGPTPRQQQAFVPGHGGRGGTGRSQGSFGGGAGGF